MNVLVLASLIPFRRGPFERFCETLVDNILSQGADAELMRLPCATGPDERMLDEIAVARSLRITGVDRVIALQFPSYLAPHPNKVIWVLGQYEPAYAETGGQGARSERSGTVHSLIRSADSKAFAEARAVYAADPAEQARLRLRNGVDAPVLGRPSEDDATLDWPATVAKLLS